MVSLDSVDHLGAFLVLAAYIYADLYMGAFDLVVERLADIMQQTCTSCKGSVHAKLARHDTGEVSHLNGVVEDVLAVGSPVAQTSDKSYQLVVQTVHVGFHHSAFALLADTLLDLLARLFHGFLDASRVDTAVLDKSFKGDTRDLAAYLVKA